MDGKAGGEMPLPSLGAANGSVRRLGDAGCVFPICHRSICPTSIYRYNLKTRKMETWSKLNVPIDSDEYTVEQVWYESKDKTRIPMFLFYKKGVVTRRRAADVVDGLRRIRRESIRPLLM